MIRKGPNFIFEIDSNRQFSLMRSSPFKRGQPQCWRPQSKRGKNIRSSLDSTCSPSRQPLAKPKLRKDSIQIPDKKPRENGSSSKNKALYSQTTKNSINATRTNSPFKHSLASSVLIQPPAASSKNYKFFYQIGFGAFGRVWKVMQKESGLEYALKQIAKQKVLQKGNVHSILNERIILSQLNHPFIVNIKNAFQDENNLYLSMDYLRGADLRYHICYKQQFSDKEIRFIAACLVVALEYVHASNIIHKDIKPQNILFQQNGYVRLTDFGIAKIRSQENNPQKIESSGTPVYMAPEILFKSDFSFESDFYSLGVVLFELALGRRPYLGKSRNEIRQQLMNKQICLSEFQLNKKIAPDLINLINKLLKKNPSQRLGRQGIREIKQHPFFKSTKWAKLNSKQMKPPFIPNVVCQTQNYLNQISLFNEMNQQQKENIQRIDPRANKQFQEYNYQREQLKEAKPRVLKKTRRCSQGKIQF